MRKLLIALLILPVATIFAATEQIRIMTFNIPYGNIKVTDGNGQNTWQNRALIIHAYFANVLPDLIGMQEPVRDELQSLLSGMPGYAMVGMARDNGMEKGEYTPILYRTQRFRVLATDNYWLTETPDVVSRVPGSGHNRIATWALFEDKQTGAQFIYTNTHLSYETEAVKFAQIKILKTHMKELADRYGSSLPQFLTGDFNMQETETENYNYVQNYQLIMFDVWMKAKKRLFHKGDMAWGSRIDYIYATKSVTAQYAQWDFRKTDDGFIMSDHDPLWADVTFTTSTADNMRGAINEAWAQIDSTYTYTHSRTKQLTSASMLSSDGTENGYPLSNLLDGSTATFAHSLYSTTAPNQPHYVQANLKSPIQAFRFQYNRREGDQGLLDRWQDVMVTASNDGQTWDYITELYDFGSDDVRTQTSDVIEMHQPYSQLRFSVMHTPGERIRNSHPQWAAAELQIFESNLRSNSLYSTNADVAAAVDALKELIAQMKQKLAEGSVKRADVTELTTATDALRQACQKANAITAVGASPSAAPRIYAPDGTPRPTLQRGLNIVHQADGARKVLWP